MAGRGTPQRSLARGAIIGIGAAALAAAVPGSPAAADSRPQQPSANAFTAQAPSPLDAGVLGRFARWLDASLKGIDDGLKDALGGVEQFGDQTREAVKGAANEVSESAQSLAALSDARLISKRALCPPAANGAPDCRRAAEAICRREGFGSGTSFETRSEEKCSVEALLTRRAGHPSACQTETYVLRSMCQ